MLFLFEYRSCILNQNSRGGGIPHPLIETLLWYKVHNSVGGGVSACIIIGITFDHTVTLYSQVSL